MDRQIFSKPTHDPVMPLQNPGAHDVFGPTVILELKFTDRFPGWFNELVQTFDCVLTGAAKYAGGIEQRGEDWARLPASRLAGGRLNRGPCCRSTMFAGHIGAALPSGVRNPRIPGVMVSAALLPDLPVVGFILVGWESATLPNIIAITHQPEFVFPYSHGLVAASRGLRCPGGAVLMGDGSWGASRWRAAVLVALAVGSHWVLDALVHVAELPLAGAGSPGWDWAFGVTCRGHWCWKVARPFPGFGCTSLPARFPP